MKCRGVVSESEVLSGRFQFYARRLIWSSERNEFHPANFGDDRSTHFGRLLPARSCRLGFLRHSSSGSKGRWHFAVYRRSGNVHRQKGRGADSQSRSRHEMDLHLQGWLLARREHRCSPKKAHCCAADQTAEIACCSSQPPQLLPRPVQSPANRNPKSKFEILHNPLNFLCATTRLFVATKYLMHHNSRSERLSPGASI